MKSYRRGGSLLFISMLPVFLCACITMPQSKLPVSVSSETSNIHLVDSHKTHKIGFSGALIFSCYYGIYYIPYGTLAPPRIQALRDYLANSPPVSKGKHTVVIHRFDIYWNDSVDLKAHAGFRWPKAHGNDPGPLAGCKGAKKGEYYPAEIPPFYSAFLVYLDTTIDGKTYDVSTQTAAPVSAITHCGSGSKECNPVWAAYLDRAVMSTFYKLDSALKKDAAN